LFIQLYFHLHPVLNMHGLFKYLFGFRGQMLIGGPGAGMSIGNMSTHISSFPCDKRANGYHSNCRWISCITDAQREAALNATKVTAKLKAYSAIKPKILR